MAKNNKKMSPPANMTITEASGFWDEHNLFEFDGTEEVSVNFKLRRKHYLGIDREMFKKVEAQARQRNMTPEALLESWIAEKVG
jgi:CopG antitoxin of type II toxin-antitoxin system